MHSRPPRNFYSSRRIKSRISTYVFLRDGTSLVGEADGRIEAVDMSGVLASLSELFVLADFSSSIAAF
jgi:hypothetical protein